MIKIYVKSKCDNPTLEYPEHKKIASEYIPEVWKHIQENDDVRIVTCSEHIIEFIGNMIYQSNVSSEEVMLYVEDEFFNYDTEGVLQNWRYGYFYRDTYEEERYTRIVEGYDDGFKAGYIYGEFTPNAEKGSKRWIEYDRGYREGRFDAYFGNSPD